MKPMLRHLGRMAILVLLAGFCCALLVRLAPGSSVDEREFDRSLSEDNIARIRAERTAARAPVRYFLAYLNGLRRADLGYSASLHAPIAELIAQRAPVTLIELAAGWGSAWLLGLALALPAALPFRLRVYDVASTLAAGVLLSVPAALLAYLCLVAGAWPQVVVALVLLPRIFRFARGLFEQGYAARHVEMARATGQSETRILIVHVLPVAAPGLVALAVTTVSMAIGACIPIEAICDVPGLGRLAWQAALARDLPLLVNLTMLVALATMAAAALGEVAVGGKEATS